MEDIFSMKKLLSIASTLVVLSTFSACSKNSGENKSGSPANAISASNAAPANPSVVPSNLSNDNFMILNESLQLQNQEDPASSTFIFSGNNIYQKVGEQLYLVSSGAEPSALPEYVANQVLTRSRCMVSGTDLEMGTSYAFNIDSSVQTSSSTDGGRVVNLIGSALDENSARIGSPVAMTCIISPADLNAGGQIVEDMFSDSVSITDGLSELISLVEEPAVSAPTVQDATVPADEVPADSSSQKL